MKRVVCFCVLVVSLVAMSGCGATKQSYVTRGKRFFAAGKYEDASLSYRRAIQKDAGYGEAYYHLGLAKIKLNQASEAYDALYRAVQLMPDNVDAKEKFADVCLSFYLADHGRPQVLYSQLKRLSDELLSKKSDSYEGLMLRGYLASTDRKPKEAIDFFRKALQANPSNPGVVTELVHVLIQDGEVQEGETLAKNLIANLRTSYGPVYDLLYDFYLDANRASEAENVLKAKVNNNPKNADYFVQLAWHYNRTHNPVEMKGTLQRLLDDPRDFPDARLRVGDFYLGLRDYVEANEYYEQGLRINPQSPLKVAYQKRSVLAQLSQGKREEATRLAAQILKENPKDDEALHLHAGILLDSGKRENADAAAREFQALLRDQPGDASLRLQLGRAYRLKGDLHAARDQFQEAINGHRDLFVARYELAEISLIQQRPTEALSQANEILKLLPNDRRAKLLRTSGLIGTGDGVTARADLARLIKEFPQDPEPQLQLGFLALAEHKYPEAIDVLAKNRNNGDPRVFEGLAIAYLNQKLFDKALETLNEGLIKWPDSSMLLEKLASTEALAGRYDRAIAQFQKLLSLDPKSIGLRRRLAEVYGLKGDHGTEILYYQQARDLAPNDVIVVLNLADALARIGRTDEAQAEYQRIVKTHPENAIALNNAAFFLADTNGDLDEALSLAQKALQKVPGQPGFSDTVGYIYLKKGMLDSAIQTFNNLARKYPSDASFRYHLGLALYQKGVKSLARKELEAALADHPSPQDQLRIRALLDSMS